MTEIDTTTLWEDFAFTNLIAWYRIGQISKLIFFTSKYEMGITLKQTILSGNINRDNVRVFQLTDDEVERMIVPRII